eukprot:2525188-Rhodomonas_salina.1
MAAAGAARKKYKEAYAKLKTECSQFVAKQGLTPSDLADERKRKEIVAAMHSDLSILALIKDAGGGLQKRQEKALLGQLLVQVKMEKTDRKDMASAILQQTQYALPVIANMPTSWHNTENFDSDEEIHKNLVVLTQESVRSTTARALTAMVNLDDFFFGKDFYEWPMEKIFERYDELSPLAICSLDQPCLLCFSVMNKSAACLFARQSTNHWTQAYTAVVFALWSEGYMIHSTATDMQKAMLNFMKAESKKDDFKSSAVCPDLVLEYVRGFHRAKAITI